MLWRMECRSATSPLISKNEAQRQLGVTIRQIDRLVESGQLATVNAGKRSWLIRNEVQALRDRLGVA